MRLVAGCEAMESNQDSLWQKIMPLNGHTIFPAFVLFPAPSYVVPKDHSVLRDSVW